LSATPIRKSVAVLLEGELGKRKKNQKYVSTAKEKILIKLSSLSFFLFSFL